MKIKLLQTEAGYQTVTFDESKMVPDPEFKRVLVWHAARRLDPQGPAEAEADFKKREEEHAAEVAAYLEQILREAQLSYQQEFSKTAPAEIREKDF